jgi:hypothetical protein
MSSIFDGRHVIPVNRQAANALMKTPWWAAIPDTVKEQLFSKEIPFNVAIDVTKQPPSGTENYIGRHYGKLTVIGYADTREEVRTRVLDDPKPKWWIGHRDARPRRKSEVWRKRFWWCFCSECQSVERFASKALRLAAAQNFGCTWCSTWFRTQSQRDYTAAHPKPFTGLVLDSANRLRVSRHDKEGKECQS